MQLLRHRRCHYLLQGREVQGGESWRKNICGQEHNPLGRIQKERYPDHLQYGIQERQRRGVVHETLLRERHLPRQGIRPHARRTRHESALFLGEPQRRSRNNQSVPETEAKGEIEHNGKGFPDFGHKRAQFHGQFVDQIRRTQNNPQTQRRVYVGRTQSMVRLRHIAP